MLAETRRNRKFTWLVVAGAAAIGAVALGVPWTTVLLVALVLCCPLMMLFMDHGGHGGHDERQTDAFRR